MLGAVLIGGGAARAAAGRWRRAPDWGWGATTTLGLLALGVVLLALWTRNELRVDAPLVELRLLRRRAVLTANVTGLVLGVAMYLGISLVTQVVQLPTGIDADGLRGRPDAAAAVGVLALVQPAGADRAPAPRAARR